jgi:hypothetical protein
VYERQVRDAGLHVERAEEWSGPIRFADVGTLLLYLRMMPWQLPVDFTVERYAAQLVQLDRLVFTESCFLLLARRDR